MTNFSDTDGIQAIGLMSSLRTGNVIIDAMIAMIIPMIIKASIRYSARLMDLLLSIFNQMGFLRSRRMHERCIINEKTDITYFYAPPENENETLIKAIIHHIDRNKLIQLPRAEINLVSDEKSPSKTFFAEHEDGNKALADVLKNHRVIEKPHKGVWCNVGSYGKEVKGKDEVWLKIDVSIQDISTQSIPARRTTQTMYLQSRGKTSITAFIGEAYESYMKNLKLLIDDGTRYHYEVEFERTDVACDDDKKNKNADEKDKELVTSLDRNVMKYRRAELSSEKTFDCLFFQQKKELLKIVDHFTKKTGKYAIQGYPHKFGLLLHGPPGTGKTSIIKALAEKTGRSLVNVPLAKISTNEDLANLLFNRKYHVASEDVSIPLSFKDVIFVLEDIDAVTHIVRRRDAIDNDTGAATREQSQSQRKDELNLSGLLNVLDGVVDTPGRMLVMTTNHPDVLDPALLRPGRIDKKMHLSYLTYDDMAALIAHYFQTEVDDEMLRRLKLAVNGMSNTDTSLGLKLTPAQVEYMAIEHDTVEDILSSMELKAKSITVQD